MALASCLAFCEVLIVKEVKGVLEKRILSWNKWSECWFRWLLIGGKSAHSVLKEVPGKTLTIKPIPLPNIPQATGALLVRATQG